MLNRRMGGLRAHLNTLENKTQFLGCPALRLVFIQTALPSLPLTRIKGQYKLISSMSGALGIKMWRLRKRV